MKELAGIADDDELWRRWLTCRWVRSYERGECTAADFAAGMVADWVLPLTPQAFLDEFTSWPGGPLPDAEELVAEVRRTVPVGCLSNTNALHWDHNFSQWPILDGVRLPLPLVRARHRQARPCAVRPGRRAAARPRPIGCCSSTTTSSTSRARRRRAFAPATSKVSTRPGVASDRDGGSCVRSSGACAIVCAVAVIGAACSSSASAVRAKSTDLGAACHRGTARHRRVRRPRSRALPAAVPERPVHARRSDDADRPAARSPGHRDAREHGGQAHRPDGMEPQRRLQPVVDRLDRRSEPRRRRSRSSRRRPTSRSRSRPTLRSTVTDVTTGQAPRGVGRDRPARSPTPRNACCASSPRPVCIEGHRIEIALPRT